ncbi:type II toxin-antitoxin system prevent-host-death family antitoxin [Salinicola socius]|uniref:type II toxin-antitoxin system prevent-host-death family antitoxin n=1 Tax=Salinicola socius TaxID=404433 RepID=UPI000B1AB059|nr:type II toxin-antitoxin system prevent-host-death family antitoxin [Salinicola socius]
MQVSTRDLRLRTRELMAATARGEKIVITYRGTPSAVMSPWEGAATSGEQRNDRAKSQGRNPAHGLWRDDRAMFLVEEYALSHNMQMADALIAATALDRGITLMTANDRHYRHIDGLEIELF